MPCIHNIFPFLGQNKENYNNNNNKTRSTKVHRIPNVTVYNANKVHQHKVPQIPNVFDSMFHKQSSMKLSLLTDKKSTVQNP